MKYEVFERMGNCMICSKRHDLRMGVCFSCSPKVDGEKIPHGHRLWDMDNPENSWVVGAP